VLAADILDLLDSTLTNIAAPTIVASLGGGVPLLKWLGSSYTLAMGVLLVTGGRLGDKFGQRRMFLTGQIGFTVSSAVVGLSVNPEMMVAARLCQGAFGALLIPQGMAIMTAVFPRDFLSKAFSAFGPALGVAMVAGPPLGGLIISANLFGLAWRPMFLVNIAIGVVATVAAVRFLPRIPGDPGVRVDLPGAAGLGGAMLGLMFGFIEGSTDGWSLVPLASVAAGLACFVAFAARQATSEQPLLKPTLLRNRGFTAGLLLGLFYFAVAAGALYVTSLFLQLGLGRRPSEAAVDLVPMTIGIIASSMLNAPLTPRLGRRLTFIGVLLTIAGASVILATVAAGGLGASAWGLESGLLVLGLGMGACFGTLFEATLSAVTPEEAGSASGSLSAVQQLAGCVGSAAITTVYFGQLPSGGHPGALEASLAAVIGVALVCSVLVWRLPAKIRAGEPG
ncbi:MAG TPA: MFS transporter, partial [Solirubrobacterales bacterium]